MSWITSLDLLLEIKVLTKMLPTKGNLAYEYNPFRNYRLTLDMYEYENDLYTTKLLEAKFGITWDETVSNGTKVVNGELKNNPLGAWKKNGEQMTDNFPTPKLKGELVDFITDELSFDLKHPVTMVPQYSYDGSVNLILTDGKNTPRLINSRFSATGKDTYEIIDRAGNNDTNIYDLGELFDVDTSLYKRVLRIPLLELKGVFVGGQLKCGNYHFYFKYADADGNETDFIAESGTVSLFMGSSYPNAIYTGNKNENTTKLVSFKISNVDPSYNYIKVYYTRATAEDGENRVIEYVKIDKNFETNNQNEASILITGFEETILVTAEDLNLSYNLVDSADCMATAQSMLFLGNVHKPNIPYNDLRDAALRFLPYLKEEVYNVDIDEEYNISSTEKGYYDPVFIYNKVGYWNEELYRFGIVFILNTGELSPVFNIRGRENLTTFKGDLPNNTVQDSLYSYYKFKDSEDKRLYIKYNELSNIILPPEGENEGIPASNSAMYENTKGVISLKASEDFKKIYSIEIRVDEEVNNYLRSLGVKGYFFVRQTRMPTVLAQGITIGIDKEGRIPTIPTKEGVLDDISSECDGSTYVETEDITTTNYVSEGFLTRYLYDLVKDGVSWGLIGKIAGIVAAVAAMVVLSIVTFGGAAITAGVVLATVAVAAAAAAAAAATSAVVMATVEAAMALARLKPKKLEGRNTKVPYGRKREETDSSRILGGSFKDRLIVKDRTKNEIGAILCPEYDINSLFYNSLFTGGEFSVKTTKYLAKTLETYALVGEKKAEEISSIEAAVADGTVIHSYPFINKDRHFYMPWSGYSDVESQKTYTCKLQGVPDDVACVTIGKFKFRSKAGNASEAWRYECIGDNYKIAPSYFSSEEDVEQSKETGLKTEKEVKKETENKEINSDIVRGSYGPYIGMVGYKGSVGETVLIMVPGYSEGNMKEYFLIRMLDTSPFYAVTDRFDLTNLDKFYFSKSRLSGDTSNNLNCAFPVYRGDCYICQFTHRLNRNFNDENSPYNSDIVDSKSWKNHYKVEKSEEFEKINLGDVNAVNLGMWITFTVRASKNLNVRSLDGSVVEETVMMGHPRGFYPHYGMFPEGTYKSPEALVYNDGFAKNLSERFNFTLPDTPYIKNWYGTRIMYSDIHINDGYRNGFRVFLGLNYRDYTRLYGSIVKLMNYEDNLFIVFEHGLALIPINERAVAAQGAGGSVYINTSNVLPEHPKIISETFGSLWPDSVISVPYSSMSLENGVGHSNSHVIFGVDTCAKKIWMYDGSAIRTISDFKVQEFLNQNLTLTEREKTPILGIRNVKTSYNAFKLDVMFTFYDDLKGTEEKVWNLCYNILLGKFITFYSWVPSFMENINNIPFSFNRDVSKWIAKLGQSHSENSFAEGIVLSNNVYNNDGSVDLEPYINYRYLNTDGGYGIIHHPIPKEDGLIGVLNLMEDVLPLGDNLEYFIKFELLRDIYGYWKKFTIKPVGSINLETESNGKAQSKSIIPIYGLYFKQEDKNVKTETNSVGTLLDKVITGMSEDKTLYFSEVYYRNLAGRAYNDYDDYKVTIEEKDSEHCTIPANVFPISSKYYATSGNVVLKENNYFDIVQTLDLPIFHDRSGNRVTLKEPIKKENLVLLLNIRATIYAKYAKKDLENTLSFADFMNYLKSSEGGSEKMLLDGEWFNAGNYESSIALTSKWNMQFLNSDFWRHGLAGVFDKTEDVLPTKWYGEQHPFEFEFVVVNDPGIHKIFHNLELISNKAKPESFHFEVIGEAYDFAKDKPNMYFRQEARKALFLYNGCDVSYNRNFLKINPKQLAKSAELVYQYYERLDTLENVYDNYLLKEDPIKNSLITSTYYNAWSSMTPNKDYRHLSGAEIVYYPNRQEYRIWLHLPAINIDDLPLDLSSSVIRGNCLYLEDRWRVSINPLLVCYKNEYNRRVLGPLCLPLNSNWPHAQTYDHKVSKALLPPITIRNTNLPISVKKYIGDRNGEIQFPNEETGEGKDNALYGLYAWPDKDNPTIPIPIDNTNWLNDLGIYKMNFGEAQNRKETDIRDKFVKIRVRYSGEELAVIDFLNTIYTVSYA